MSLLSSIAVILMGVTAWHCMSDVQLQGYSCALSYRFTGSLVSQACSAQHQGFDARPAMHVGRLGGYRSRHCGFASIA